MNKVREILVKIALLYGLILLFGYLFFRALFINFNPYLIVFSFVLILAELHNMIQLFVMIYSLWPRKHPVYNRIFKNKKANINIFICVCGEPAEIVRSTIEHAKAAVEKYVEKVKPETAPKIVVLNDGFAAGKENASDIKALAKELGVAYVARKTTLGFKAGNINNGLKTFKAKDSFNTYDVVLDADFAPISEFLLEITKPFVENNIDFVQTPQRYRNQDSWIAQASAAHQIHFFKHVCPTKAYDNALFLCGTNFAIRRQALEDVGGVDERFITEDYATSLNLHLAGKKGAFIEKPLAYGIAPSTLKAYFSQQQRWSKGTFDTTLVYWRKILFGPLSTRQKFQYAISSIYYLSGLRNLIFILAPLPYLFFGKSLMGDSFFDFIKFVYAPLFLYNFTVYFLLFEHPLKSWVLDTITFPVYVSSFFGSILKKKLDFIVTIKKHEKENILRVYRTQLILIPVLLNALVFGISQHRTAQSLGEFINFFWVFFNTFILSLGLYLYFRDNYIDEVDNLTSRKIRVKASSLIPVLEKLVILPLIFLIFIGVAFQNSHFRKSFDSAKGEVIASVKDAYSQSLVPASEGVYFGYYLPNFNEHPVEFVLSPVKDEKTSLLMFYQDWAGEKEFDTRFMNSISDKNAVAVITWEPWDAKKGEQGIIKQSSYSPKLIAQGKYDNYIRSFAKSAVEYQKPYFLRFAHEMNGNWYSWGQVNESNASDYVKMWQHVHDIFVEEGATNTIWVWAPNNVNPDGILDGVMDFYPGDKYVDWVGYSGFNWGDTKTFSWSRFSEVTSDVYDSLLSTGKPIMVAETGTVGADAEKANWMKALTKSIENFPEIKAIVFYSADFKNIDFKLSNDKTMNAIHEDIDGNPYFVKYPVFENNKIPLSLSRVSLLKTP